MRSTSASRWPGAARRGASCPRRAALRSPPLLLVGSIFVADRFGLVALIAQGYRALAWLFLVVYVLPLLTLGVWRCGGNPAAAATAT